MMNGVRFSSFSLDFPRGKVQIAQDNTTGNTIAFSNWALVRTIVPPYRAVLLDNQGDEVAEYPVRQELKPGGRLNYVIDELDAIGAQG